MNLMDILRFSAGGLSGHRLRTGLSLLGVAIGVASVITLTSLGEGARLFVTGEFASLGSNLLIVIPGKTETQGATPFISQAVAVGRGKDFVGALIYPDRQRLEEWARRRAVPTASLVDEPAVRELFAAELVRINPLIEVKYQRVRRAVLAEKEPSFNTGELTPSGKLVRKVVNRLYKDKLDAMYKGEPGACVIEVEQPLLQRTMS